MAMHDLTADPISVEIIGGSSAPWWGVPVIAGGFLLLGALLGFVLNRINEQSKQRREANTRWHDLIRELSAEIVTRSDQLWEMRFQRNQIISGMENARQEFRSRTAEIDAVQVGLISKANELKLLAPSNVSDAAREIVKLTFAGSKEGRNLMQEQEDLKQVFMHAVRHHFEIEP